MDEIQLFPSRFLVIFWRPDNETALHEARKMSWRCVSMMLTVGHDPRDWQTG